MNSFFDGAWWNAMLMSLHLALSFGGYLARR